MKSLLFSLLVLFCNIIYAQKSIIISSPQAGNRWQKGRSQLIKWTSSGGVTNVKLEYSTDNGLNWISSPVPIPPVTDGPHPTYWTVPASASESNSWRLRISDTDAPSVYDQSSAFSVISLSIDQPTANKHIDITKETSVGWTASANMAGVDLGYSVDGGATWQTFETNVLQNPYTLSLPLPFPATGTYRLRVRDSSPSPAAGDPEYPPVEAVSSDFYVTRISLTEPANGKVIQSGKPLTFDWAYSGNITNVNIEYRENSSSPWTKLNSSPISVNARPYSDWSFPANISSDLVQVRISDAAEALGVVGDTKTGISARRLSLLTPGIGTYLQTGKTYPITWECSSNISNVRLEYYDGTAWHLIDNLPSVPAANPSSYSWVVPANIASDQCQIRVSDAGHPVISDIRYGFSVRSLALTANPASGEHVKSGSSYEIKWTNSSNISRVRLQYYNGADWTNIADVNTTLTENTSIWNVPSGFHLMNNCRIRVVDISNSSIPSNSILSESPAFSVIDLSIIQPNGGEHILRGTGYEIKWRSAALTEADGNFILEYRKEGDQNWTLIPLGHLEPAPLTDVYSHTFSAFPSAGQYEIRISDAANPTKVNVASAGYFSLIELSLSAPTLNQHFSSGKTIDITWDFQNLSNVKLEYSLNNGSTWTTISSSVPASDRSYTWNIPSSAYSDVCKIRISDVVTPTVNVISSSFYISSVALVSPNGTENWVLGKTYPVTWTASPNTQRINLYLIPEGGVPGAPFQQINLTAGSPSSFDWTIPQATVTGKYKIRIADSNVPATIYDESDNLFVISQLQFVPPTSTITSLKVGETYNITWMCSPTIPNVKLEYSTDAGATWSTIVPSVPSTNPSQYGWIVPDKISTNCFIKVSSVANPEINAVTPKFSIEGTLWITAPNGGETWTIGDIMKIEWGCGASIQHVRLDYTTGNGIWHTIVNTYDASLKEYSWQIPNTPSATCKVKIIDLDNTSNSDVSDNLFKIAATPSVALTRPNGGETFVAGTSQAISWISSFVSTVKIEYSTDNGQNFLPENTIADNVPSTGTYNWFVPNVQSAQCRIKISDASNPLLTDMSNAPFSITPRISFRNPEVGIQNAFSKYKIEWTSSNVSNLKIEYSTDDKFTWNTIITAAPAYANSYEWIVPDIPSTQCFLRLSDAANPLIYAVSNVFTISSVPDRIIVISPNGGESWQTGSSRSITWMSSSNINTINMDYSTNNGLNWFSLPNSTAPASDGMYKVTLPGVPGNQYKIRIKNAADVSEFDVSDNTFTLSSLTLITVFNSAGFQVGSKQEIKWSSSYLSRVNLEYSIDNGKTWLPIVSNIESSGIYYWNIPNTPSTQCKVRISDSYNPPAVDVDNPGTFDISSSFTIIQNPMISVTYPSGGEVLTVGSTQAIRWQSFGIVNNVKIDLSTNNGTNWTPVASSVPNSGTYNWVVPNVNSTQCKIKISDLVSPSVLDTSHNVFTITSVPRIIVTAPNGNENYQAGSTQLITWSSNNVSKVKLDYTIDNGVNWNKIADSAQSSGVYSWRVPTTPSTQCKVRISDVSNLTINDVSNDNFIISEAPYITLLYPNGSENFEIGKTEIIKWKSGGVNNVYIYYSLTNGSDWNLITHTSVASTGSYSWAVPGLSSNLCKIKICDATKPELFDVSDSVFTIATAPKITVILPNGNENYQTGSVQTVKWSSTNVNEVKIEYSINNGIVWTPIVTSYKSSGLYSWQIPDTASTQCKIRISDMKNPGVYDISDNNFIITEGPLISVQYPNAGEVFKIGSTEILKWKSRSVNNVKLEYTVNGGTSWNLITSSAINSGSWSWTVPNTVSNKCKIKVSDVAHPELYDTTDSYFSITNTPKITIQAPNGDESYQVGSMQSIKWSSVNVSNVIIEFSINNGIDWYMIKDSYASSGIYLWTIPDTTSTQCLVRISDVSNPLVYDVSDKIFTISSAPAIQITSPNGKEVWEIGRTQYITWNSSNTKNVKIEYTVNNGSNWTIVASAVPSTGSYSWVVPNAPSYQCRIKVSDIANPAVYDQSDAVFTISASPKVTVTSPNGGDVIKTGSQKIITWTSNNVENVMIEFSVNNGVSWKTIAESIPSTGQFVWTVPGTASYQCRIRISDASNANIVDMSDNAFTISSIQVLTPSPGEPILTGSQCPITWQSDCINNVRIEYSVDKGTNWTLITSSTSALSGSYNWNVPTLPVAQCLIRISDVTNASVFDKLENTFPIQSIIVTSPSENTEWEASTTQQIQWKSNIVNNVKLEYSTDSGVKWNLISSAIAAKTGSFMWIVPNVPSDFCNIRISDASNPQNSYTNKNYFSIKKTTGVELASDIKPDCYLLLQNHPNPFNPATRIRFHIPEVSFVSLKVYDLMGKEVCTLVNEEKTPGVYQVTFDAQSLANGVYIYQLQAGNFVSTKKLILMK